MARLRAAKDEASPSTDLGKQARNVAVVVEPRRRRPRDGGSVTDPFALTLPPEAVEQIVELVVERVLASLREDREPPRPEWLYGAKAAADYLGFPSAKSVTNRLKGPHSIPYHRDRPGRRLSFNSQELDEWRLGGGEHEQG